MILSLAINGICQLVTRLNIFKIDKGNSILIRNSNENKLGYLSLAISFKKLKKCIKKGIQNLDPVEKVKKLNMRKLQGIKLNLTKLSQSKIKIKLSKCTELMVILQKPFEKFNCFSKWKIKLEKKIRKNRIKIKKLKTKIS
ncbi:hypothetical protein [Chryseobacterium sp.]|uniref:hypothetical protein n=1 Tax=Chryseobacterium sp. TaxID=1871047 RepID=UPI00321A054D